MKILISEPLTDFIVDDLKNHFDVEYQPDWYLRPVTHSAEILVTRSQTQVNAELINYLPNLKSVVVYGVGANHVNHKGLQEKKIELIKGLDENALSTAEHTLGLILSCLKKIPASLHQIEEKQWNRDVLMGRELYGKKVLVLGVGPIGRRVAYLLSAFGCEISYARKSAQPLSNCDWKLIKDWRNELLNFDFISLHLPAQQEPIFTDKEFAMMSPKTILVNTSRGQLVDHRALFSFLDRHPHAQYLTDVWQDEPPQSWPSQPQITLTPHIAGLTVEALERLHATILRQIRQLHEIT